jgi:hypothetical protein
MEIVKTAERRIFCLAFIFIPPYELCHLTNYKNLLFEPVRLNCLGNIMHPKGNTSRMPNAEKSELRVEGEVAACEPSVSEIGSFFDFETFYSRS